MALFSSQDVHVKEHFNCFYILCSKKVDFGEVNTKSKVTE